MPRPPLDENTMRDLAVRMAKANPGAGKELRRFIAGETTVTDALPGFRAVARELVVFPSGKWPGHYNVSRELRADVNAWVAAYGLGKEPRGGDPTSKAVPTRYTTAELDGIERAAKLAGVQVSTYIRQAVNAAVERDLAKARQVSAV